MKKSILALSLLCMLQIAYAKSTFSEHPLAPTMRGFEISGSDSKEFDNYKDTGFKCLPVTSLNGKCDLTQGIDQNGVFYAEGKTTKIYHNPLKGNSDISGFQIFKNFENYFKQIQAKRIDAGENYINSIFLLDKNNLKTWFVLYAGSNDYNLKIIEAKTMEQVIFAKQLAEDISKQGYVTLNVNFDNNKSIINGKDKPTLNEVVTLLKNDPTLKLSVDGYTDNVGNAAANKTLSQQRSESIVKYLTSNGVAANRLVAKGFGSESPVADNRCEEGKAKNRRVELVKF